MDSASTIGITSVGQLTLGSGAAETEINCATLDINATAAITVDTATSTTLTSVGQTTINSNAFDINALGAIYLYGLSTFTILAAGQLTLGSGIVETEINCGAFDLNASGAITIDTATTNTLTSTGETEINCAALDINATGAITIDTDDPITITSTANGITLSSFGEQDITCGSLDINSAGTATIDATSNIGITSSTGEIALTSADDIAITAGTGLIVNTTAGDMTFQAYGSLLFGATTGFWTAQSSSNYYYQAAVSAYSVIYGNNLGAEYLQFIIDGTAGFAEIYSTTCAINIYSDVGVGIGQLSDPTTIEGSTIDIDGITSINTSNALATSIGNTGALTLKGSTYSCDTTGAQTITSSTGDVTLSATDVRITSTGTSGGEFIVRANTNVDIFAQTGDVELRATTTMLLKSGGTQTVEVDSSNKMVTTTTTTTLTNTNITLNADTTVDPDNTFNMMPTATIIQNVSATVPSGFLYCNGQAVSRTVTYARLFAAIGTTFGAGNGTTTFNVPNFLGAYLRGASTQTVGGIAYAGAAVGTAQQDSVLEAYNEGYWTVDSGGGGSARVVRSRLQITADPEDTGVNSTTKFVRQNATENRVFNYSVYYYIRY